MPCTSKPPSLTSVSTTGNMLSLSSRGTREPCFRMRRAYLPRSNRASGRSLDDSPSSGMWKASPLPRESKHTYVCSMPMKRSPDDDASPSNGSKRWKSMTGGGQPLSPSLNFRAVNSGRRVTADGMWKMMPLTHSLLIGLSITALNMNPRPLRTLS